MVNRYGNFNRKFVKRNKQIRDKRRRKAINQKKFYQVIKTDEGNEPEQITTAKKKEMRRERRINAITKNVDIDKLISRRKIKRKDKRRQRNDNQKDKDTNMEIDKE